MTAEERLQPTELFPEMATLDCGTCNFGDEVFENTMPMMRDFGKRMLENRIKPEYECFEMGHLETVLNMAKKGQVPGAPMQFNFVLGVPGCTPATVPNLCWLVNAIPAGSTWTATGIGRHAFTWLLLLSLWEEMSEWGSKIICISKKGCWQNPMASW